MTISFRYIAIIVPFTIFLTIRISRSPEIKLNQMFVRFQILGLIKGFQRKKEAEDKKKRHIVMSKVILGLISLHFEQKSQGPPRGDSVL